MQHGARAAAGVPKPCSWEAPTEPTLAVQLMTEGHVCVKGAQTINALATHGRHFNNCQKAAAGGIPSGHPTSTESF